MKPCLNIASNSHPASVILINGDMNKDDQTALLDQVAKVKSPVFIGGSTQSEESFAQLLYQACLSPAYLHTK